MVLWSWKERCYCSASRVSIFTIYQKLFENIVAEFEIYFGEFAVMLWLLQM